MPVADAPRRTPAASGEPTLTVHAPAKVNLYLGVTGTRADGFHELATVFERITLADELTFSPREHEISCACDDPQVPSDGRNLVVRAAELLAARAGVTRGVHIAITKHIPAAAGLGGGSSDAATTLLTLNRWWGLEWTRTQLMALGRELGADVPFFVSEATFALGVGRGDVIVPLPPAPMTLWHVLVTPPLALSTAEVFRTWDTLGSSAGSTNAAGLAQLLTALVLGQAEVIGGLTWNHLTTAAVRLAPVLYDVEDVLTHCGASSVSVSGSGPTMLATLTSAAEAQRVAAAVQRTQPAWRVTVAQTAAPAHAASPSHTVGE